MSYGIIHKMGTEEWVLTHSWWTDDFGLKRNAFDLFHTPTRTHYPFAGMIRVSNVLKDTAYLGDDTSPYTDAEYEQMLDREVAKITSEGKK